MRCPAWQRLQSGLGPLRCGRTTMPCGAACVLSCWRTHLRQVSVLPCSALFCIMRQHAGRNGVEVLCMCLTKSC